MERNRTLLFSTALIAASTALAQTARLQVIHNSADAAAAVVDVYLNGGATPFIDDFQFRTAVGFIDVPAGVDLNIGIAPGSSTGPGDIIPGLTATYNLTDGETYVLIANGIVSPTGYTPATPFELYPMGGAETSAAGTTGVQVFHGCTDAPAVDVFESAVLDANAVTDLAYGENTGYLTLPTANYVLEVRAAGDPNTIVAYSAPLADLGADGISLVVVASGFLDPSVNSDGAGFGLWAALPTGGELYQLPVFTPPTARLQVIHNSADAAAAVVDVYLNGGATPFIDDFQFRTAVGFIDVPAGVDLNIGIAPGSSTGPGDIIPGLTATYNLMDGETYVLIANGIVSPTGYTPPTPFELYPMGGAETSAAGTTGVQVFHGCTDAPAVDVFESAVLDANAVTNLAYGENTGYLTLPTNDYVLEVRAAGDPNTIVAYSAPLATLGADGISLVVLASGFLNPANNSDGPGFGLWAALPTGGDLLELPVFTPPTARLQVIHNCADAAASVVDVYVNGGLFIDDFAFRTAFGFTDVPAGVDLNIGIAGGSSTSAADTISGIGATFNLADGETYVLIANGIVSPTGYTPNPPFTLNAFAPGREAAASSSNTDILVFHGSTDAPEVQVAETAVLGGTVIVPPFSYGEYSASYLEVPTNDYVLQVQLPDGTPVVSYQAPLNTLGLDGVALVAVASGFLAPGNNSDGPAFGIWVALPTGNDLIELPLFTSISESFGDVNGVRVWPNPANDNVTLQVDAVKESRTSVRITDIAGRVVAELANTGLSQGENRLTIPVNAFAEGSYQVTIFSGDAARSLPLQVVR